MAIKDVYIKDLIARNEVKVIGNKIFTIRRRKEEKYLENTSER